MLTPLSPNGGVFSPANLQADSDFFVINTVIGLATGDVGDYATPNDAQNLQKLIEMISLRVNPKYIKVSSAVVDLSVSGNRVAMGLGTNFNQAATTVYTLHFMTEQTKFLTAASLAALIQGVPVPAWAWGVPVNGPATANQSAYETVSASLSNISIVVSDLF